MIRLTKSRKKNRTQRHAGLTLVELLISMAVSTVVVMVAAGLVIESMEWDEGRTATP